MILWVACRRLLKLQSHSNTHFFYNTKEDTYYTSLNRIKAIGFQALKAKINYFISTIGQTMHAHMHSTHFQQYRLSALKQCSREAQYWTTSPSQPLELSHRPRWHPLHTTQPQVKAWYIYVYNHKLIGNLNHYMNV